MRYKRGRPILPYEGDPEEPASFPSPEGGEPEEEEELPEGYIPPDVEMLKAETIAAATAYMSSGGGGGGGGSWGGSTGGTGGGSTGGSTGGTGGSSTGGSTGGSSTGTTVTLGSESNPATLQGGTAGYVTAREYWYKARIAGAADIEASSSTTGQITLYRKLLIGRDSLYSSQVTRSASTSASYTGENDYLVYFKMNSTSYLECKVSQHVDSSSDGSKRTWLIDGQITCYESGAFCWVSKHFFSRSEVKELLQTIYDTSLMAQIEEVIKSSIGEGFEYAAKMVAAKLPASISPLATIALMLLEAYDICKTIRTASLYSSIVIEAGYDLVTQVATRGVAVSLFWNKDVADYFVVEPWSGGVMCGPKGSRGYFTGGEWCLPQ